MDEGLAEVPGWVGTALLWAAAATLAAWALSWAARRPLGPAALLALGLALFFGLLTVLPLPDPAAVACPVPEAAPQLAPFAFVARIVRNWHWGPEVALLSRGPLSALANLLLCVALGAALVRAGVAPGRAVLLGVGLSLGAELTQLTALWGLYPCPIRKFDVDDLILNVGGVALGALLGRPRRRPADGAGPPPGARAP